MVLFLTVFKPKDPTMLSLKGNFFIPTMELNVSAGIVVRVEI